MPAPLKTPRNAGNSVPPKADVERPIDLFISTQCFLAAPQDSRMPVQITSKVTHTGQTELQVQEPPSTQQYR